MEFAGFDWDRGNRKKCQKHGVSIAEIESLFARVVMIAPDLQHALTDRGTVQGHRYNRHRSKRTCGFYVEAAR